VGLTPSGSLDTRQILEACGSGSVKALWLLGYDPIVEFPDSDLATRALESVEFLVCQGTEETPAMGFASVVLPMAAPAEMDGTYTSIEGRVQRIAPILTPRGDAWVVATEIGAQVGCFWPVYEAADVMGLIANDVPTFASVSFETFPGDGLLLPL